MALGVPELVNRVFGTISGLYRGFCRIDGYRNQEISELRSQ